MKRSNVAGAVRFGEMIPELIHVFGGQYATGFKVAAVWFDAVATGEFGDPETPFREARAALARIPEAKP